MKRLYRNHRKKIERENDDVIRISNVLGHRVSVNPMQDITTATSTTTTAATTCTINDINNEN